VFFAFERPEGFVDNDFDCDDNNQNANPLAITMERLSGD